MTGLTRRSTMAFFSDARCHYSQRVRIVLAEKGITVDIEECTTDKLPQELIDVNPYGSLPTLLDRELALFDSKVMMEYLDERFPHPPLLPVYPVARAECRQLIHRVERDWAPVIDKLMRDPSSDDAGKKMLAQSIIGMSPLFVDKPYFMSEEFSIADCCFAPILWRLGAVGIRIPSTRQTKPLQDYAERVFNRESFQASLSELEREMPNSFQQ